jgi:hypothetical protein
MDPNSGKAIYQAVCEKYGSSNVCYDEYTSKGGSLHFPVKTQDGRIVSSLAMSETIRRLPVIAVEHVFISPELYSDANAWLDRNRKAIIDI